MRTNRPAIWLVTLVSGLVLLSGTAHAHTESDVVAVAGGEATQITLRPTHGCGDSATIAVSTKVPAPGATPVEVAGWTATATADGDDTILEWTGGRLPADVVGAFPVAFTVPDTVGELLTFPFVQECENGEELAWIDGDPEGEFPAPRLLVLAPGSAAAATIDEVDADAPGRSKLVAIADVDNPSQPAPTTTVAAEITTTTSTTTDERGADDGADDGAEAAVDAPLGAAADDGGDSDDGGALLIGAAVVLGVAIAGGVVAMRRRA